MARDSRALAAEWLESGEESEESVGWAARTGSEQIVGIYNFSYRTNEWGVETIPLPILSKFHPPFVIFLYLNLNFRSVTLRTVCPQFWDPLALRKRKVAWTEEAPLCSSYLQSTQVVSSSTQYKWISLADFTFSLDGVPSHVSVMEASGCVHC